MLTQIIYQQLNKTETMKLQRNKITMTTTLIGLGTYSTTYLGESHGLQLVKQLLIVATTRLEGLVVVSVRLHVLAPEVRELLRHLLRGHALGQRADLELKNTGKMHKCGTVQQIYIQSFSSDMQGRQIILHRKIKRGQTKTPIFVSWTGIPAAFINCIEFVFNVRLREAVYSGNDKYLQVKIARCTVRTGNKIVIDLVPPRRKTRNESPLLFL
jgi:hypothetical protein